MEGVWLPPRTCGNMHGLHYTHEGGTVPPGLSQLNLDLLPWQSSRGAQSLRIGARRSKCNGEEKGRCHSGTCLCSHIP